MVHFLSFLLVRVALYTRYPFKYKFQQSVCQVLYVMVLCVVFMHFIYLHLTILMLCVLVNVITKCNEVSVLKIMLY